jgi:hypothetical protein
VIPGFEHETQILSYAVGEDVVVRLDGVEVLDAEHQAVVPHIFLPAWTIARIVSLVERDGMLCYLVRAKMRGLRCLSVVSEASIEGVA